MIYRQASFIGLSTNEIPQQPTMVPARILKESLNPPKGYLNRFRVECQYGLRGTIAALPIIAVIYSKSRLQLQCEVALLTNISRNGHKASVAGIAQHHI